MQQSFSLGRIAGMKVGANWSLIVVVWLIAWSLADTQLPAVVPGRSEPAYWAVGVSAALVFFGCLLAHELSHSIVARRNGVEVEGIVLWLFGGVSHFKGDPPTAEAELRVAVAGPATSTAIALVFFGLSRLVEVWSDGSLLAAGLGWLGWINGLLAAFNMVPAFPLDGGRVLRAWLWHRRGDKTSATLSAANAGRVFAYLLIGLGALQFAAGSLVGGAWLVFLGWFLLTASSAEAAQSIIGPRLSGTPVRAAMTPHPVTAPDHLTIDQLITGWLERNRCSTFPVVDATGNVVGLLTIARVKGVRPEARATTRVVDVACPAGQIVRCDPDEPLLGVVARMNASADQRALVFEDGVLVGIVSPSDITRTIEHAGLLTSARS